jgi:hypothetical protein
MKNLVPTYNAIARMTRTLRSMADQAEAMEIAASQTCLALEGTLAIQSFNNSAHCVPRFLVEVAYDRVHVASDPDLSDTLRKLAVEAEDARFALAQEFDEQARRADAANHRCDTHRHSLPTDGPANPFCGEA